MKYLFKGLQNLSDSEFNLEKKSTAENLLELINFDIVCLLNTRNQILSSIHHVDQALQKQKFYR